MHPLSKAVALWALITGIILIAVINSVSARDPTSVFFDPKTGYQPSYSDFRRRQAIDFISGHNATESLEHPRVEKKEQTLCVGIPSIGRGGAQYMIATIGSLLEGLTPEERSDMFLVVFIAHTDPSTHPLYGEPWLHQLTDHVLTYNLDEREMQVVRTMEDEGGAFQAKGLYDYSYLLSKCAEQYTPYIAIFEDDTIAMDGWFHRTIIAIREAEH